MRPCAQTSNSGVVRSICALSWSLLSERQLTDAAWAYYFFSIQFRENLLVGRKLHPGDPKLAELEEEECHTANLSPYQGVAAPGERMDHDEFMRRALALGAIEPTRQKRLCEAGGDYLKAVAALDENTRAQSIVSYEDGGLECVFRAMLTAPEWDTPVLGAFRHFLEGHIRLDAHHGTLVHHLETSDRAAPLWILFHDLLVSCVPALLRESVTEPECAITPAIAARSDGLLEAAEL